MKQGIFTIEKNLEIAPDLFEMTLAGEGAADHRPGQFVNIALNGLYLRRPISVHDIDPVRDTVTIIYKVVGHGTRQLAGMARGEKLDVLCGLGNGFDFSAAGQRCFVIGGGVGTPPMFLTAKALAAAGKQVTAVLGFNTASEIICRDKFLAAGIETVITTADGSEGVKGFVTSAIATLPAPDYTFSCGPIPMLKAVYDATECSGQFSFEERMGCGFGACMGCTCKTKYGNKRICKDGPVLVKEEIIW